jgi:hypothetical protein
MENIFLQKYVNDVVVETIDIDPVSNTGTIKLFDGDDVTVFTRKLVNGLIEVRNSDDEIIETDNLSWLFIYGVHDYVDEATRKEHEEAIAEMNAELENKTIDEVSVYEEVNDG